ncbi:MAG: ABC transporter ATP-binding protein [Candidatus Hodarchaeota archaeon]
MTDIKIKNLVKKYGNTYAVNNINLDIKDGELFILLGPSGCGKTTTLLCIAGLIKPDEGEIWFDKKLMTHCEKRLSERPQNRNIAMVFQDYAIYPHMTVFKNIAFPLQISNWRKDEIEKRVHETAKSLDIEGLLERKPRQLSGGQRQRVALARAIVREPAAFLMDEPLSNLDAKLRVFARAELKKLHKKLGTTIIYVTHDQIEAMSIGDTIAILNEGVLEQVGKPNDIYNFPENLFVAGFIGSPPMNMLDGIFTGKSGNMYIDLGFTEYKLPNRFEKIKQMNINKMVLGIRPEDILISSEKVDNSIKAIIDIIEPMGREVEIHLNAGGHAVIALAKSIENLKVGNEIYLILDDNKIHLFDKETKKNVIKTS